MTSGLIIMPVIDNLPLTLDAISDSLQQLGGAAQVLVINQGSTHATRTALEDLAASRPRLHVITHDPPLPALGSTWNRALEFAWATGHEDALVVNNDVRMGAWIYEDLRAARELHALWFASPVNVRDQDGDWQRREDLPLSSHSLGGPDFSCFLLTREGHTKYPFDTRFVPAWHEDNDLHRRYWVGGDGARIAGLPIPYLHYGSSTINRSPEAKVSLSRQFDTCRAAYIAKWGGPPHQERKVTPDSDEDFDGVGTPGGWLGGKYPTIAAWSQTNTDGTIDPPQGIEWVESDAHRPQ